MIMSLLCGISLLYGYAVSGEIRLCILSIPFWLMAAGCHQKVCNRLDVLEKRVAKEDEKNDVRSG